MKAKMTIGFIGAGKVGCSLGKYLSNKNNNDIIVTGYYSKSLKSAELAANFTETKAYSNIKDILKDSDTLFVTVPDGAIAQVWDYMRNLDIKNKNICHCSGSISSTAFFNAQKCGAYTYSIHPLYAINDKYKSWQSLDKAFFAIEGSALHRQQFIDIFKRCGNRVIALDTEKKILYHAAAVMASNLSTALLATSADMLESCGFTSDEAIEALLPLFVGNAANIAHFGIVNALTGPIERNDVSTVKNHLQALQNEANPDWQNLYLLLSQRLIKIAQAKDTTKNYVQMEEFLTDEKHCNDF